MPLKLSRIIQAGLPIASFRLAADLLDEVALEEEVGSALIVREPVGVVGAITPWNYPLHQVACKVAPALAAGCTVVLKPSEVAPLSAFILAEVVDEAGLPAGVFNLVTGTGPVVGEAIASDPDVDMVSFTGSTRAGKRVSELASASVKRVALELGGKSPYVILDDADLSQAVPNGVAKAFLNSGQTCSALTRMLVPRERLAEAEQIAAATAEKFAPADPTGDRQRDRPARLGRAARARARLHPQGRRGGRAARDGRRRAAGGPAARLLRAPDRLLRRDARHDDRPGGDLRPGARADARTTTRTTPCGSPTTRSTAWPRACGPATPTAPTASPAACAPARSRSTAAQFDLRRRSAASSSPGIGRENGKFGLEEYLEAKALLR